MKKNIIYLLITYALFFCFTGCSKEDMSTSVKITNNLPTKPKNPNPPDSITGINDSANVILRWESTDPDINDTLKFDVYVGTSLPLSDVPIAGNLTSALYNLGMLPFPGTTYYWKIKAKDNHGAEVYGEIWRFTIRTRP